MIIKKTKFCFSNHQKQDVFYSLSLFQCTANYVWRKELMFFASRLPQRAQVHTHTQRKSTSRFGEPLTASPNQCKRFVIWHRVRFMDLSSCCTVHSTTNVCRVATSGYHCWITSLVFTTVISPTAYGTSEVRKSLAAARLALRVPGRTCLVVTSLMTRRRCFYRPSELKTNV